MRALSLLLLAALLAGCTLGAPAPANPSSGAPAAKSKVTLVTYTDFGIQKAVLDDFTNATGYPVEVVSEGDAGETLNKVILSADHPLGDALFGVDNALIYRAKDHHVFAPYTPANASQIPARFRSAFEENGTLLATPFDYGYVELNVDPAWLAMHNLSFPTDLAQIADATYAPLTVVENPYTSSPGFAFLLATVDRFGDNYPTFWSDFAKHGGKISTDWGTAYGSMFTQGYDSKGSLDRPIVLSYSTSPAYNPMNGYGNATSLVLDVPKGAWFQVESVGVLAGAKNPDGAKALIDYLLRPDVQAKGAFQQVTYPVVPGASIPAEYTLYAPEPKTPATLSPDQIDAHRDAWLAGWRAATGQA